MRAAPPRAAGFRYVPRWQRRARAVLCSLAYALAGCGIVGGCLFLVILVRVLSNTSPLYLAWLLGFVS